MQQRKAKAMTSSERQRRYREKLRTGENRRIQLVLPLEVAIKVDYLTDALQCNKTHLFAELIMDRWRKEGEPIVHKKRKRRT